MRRGASGVGFNGTQTRPKGGADICHLRFDVYHFLFDYGVPAELHGRNPTVREGVGMYANSCARAILAANYGEAQSP